MKMIIKFKIYLNFDFVRSEVLSLIQLHKISL